MHAGRLNLLLVGALGACAALSAVTLAYFFRCGPMVETPPRALSWSRFEPDAGERAVDATWFGVDFVRLRDADEPVLEAGALHRGEEWIVFPSMNCFHQFVPVDGGVYVLGEWCTEGGGDSAEVMFLSSDGGATYVASVLKPASFSSIVGLEVDGDTLRISIDQNGEESVPLLDEWVFPAFRVAPLNRVRPTAGTFVTITSKNRGLSWRMDRFAVPP